MPTETASDHRPGLRVKQVLVPVDLSGAGIGAVRYALDLGREFGATITLFHVVQLNIAGEEYGVPRTRLLEELAEDTRKQLRDLLEHLGTDGVTTEIAVGTGRPHAEIVSRARKLDCDLIVMTSKTHCGFLRILRRHTAVRVVHDAACPVLLVHRHEHGLLTRDGLH
jgi:nucleotide-binding universal stress UspA family protein